MVVKKIGDKLMKKKLIEIGFTEYEAKAYLALLSRNPSTAYEVSKFSTVPSSKIYEVLSKLFERDVITIVEENKKKKYIPKNPDEMIDLYKNKMNNTLEDLRIDLNNIPKENDSNYIWNIIDYDYFIESANRLISEAKNELLISVWPQEYRLIEDSLTKTKDKGVKVAIVNFGDDNLGKEFVFRHPIGDTIYSEKGGRGFVIVADSKEVLFTMTDEDKNVQGANSMNKAFVSMAEDYIKHDIYIMKIIKRFDKLLLNKFGENYKLLRDVFNDKEIDN
jgi:sugar-specific transcriptional regulator TrmB